MKKYLNEGIERKEAMKQVAKEKNITKSEVYKECLNLGIWYKNFSWQNFYTVVICGCINSLGYDFPLGKLCPFLILLGGDKSRKI